MTPTRPRFTAREYLALVSAANLLASYADDEPAVYARDARVADKALSKVHDSLSTAELAALHRYLDRDASIS